MKKIILFIMSLFVFVTMAEAQLLYKISHKSLESSSYIVGTYHIAPETFIDSIPGAREAIELTEQVCGEVVMSEMESQENLQKVKAAMMLPDGKKLEDMLTVEEMQKLNKYMTKVVGADFTNPLIAKEMGCLTPSALATQLQLLQYIKMTPGFNPLKLIDAAFQNIAVKNNKPVIGLETVDFQIGVLYGTSFERGKQQLFCMINNDKYYAGLMKDLAAAYFSQDIDALYELTEEKMGNDCDSTPEEEEALLYARNADWAEKIPAIIADTPTLFVVGAAHLSGERGVLKLLKDKGYVVEPLMLFK